MTTENELNDLPLFNRAVGWLEHEVNEWLRQRLEERKMTTRVPSDIISIKKDEM